MKVLIQNAAQVLSVKDDRLEIIKNCSIVIINGKIKKLTQTKDLKIADAPIIDAQGKVVLPGFVDCHTHLVFAGTREDEFLMRLSGRTYEEILKAGGGILNTVQKTRAASEEELHKTAQKRLFNLIKWGTTTVEIKSGYGLNYESELKILRVIKRLKEEFKDKITIVGTFLGAHAVPPDKTKKEYMRELIDKMIPQVAQENLADFIDVFCEHFVFTADEAQEILKAGIKYGLKPKLHADELESSGGAEVAGRVKAISADHLLYPQDKGLRKMKAHKVVAVLLPGTSFFLKSRVKPPIEKLRQYKIPIALGSDYNPGTCMIYQMPIIMGLGVFLYDLTPQEAILGATLNSAKALGKVQEIGSIEVNKDADLVILNTSDYANIFYQFGTNLVNLVMKKGKVVFKS
jgi:imidazolonepropionase